MIVRSFALASLLGSVALVVAGCGWAQEPAATAADPPDAAEREGGEAAASVDDIFGPIDDQEPTAATPEAAGQPSEPASGERGELFDGPAMKTEVAATDSAKVHELTERVAALQTEVESLKATISGLEQALRRMQDPQEFSRAALGAMAEDADLRSHLGNMLQGKVRLRNATGEPQIMYINGTAWTVVPGESYVYAPVGTVSFQSTSDDEPTFKGIQEWTENELTGQFELEYRLGSSGVATETSLLRSLPERRQ